MVATVTARRVVTGQPESRCSPAISKAPGLGLIHIVICNHAAAQHQHFIPARHDAPTPTYTSRAIVCYHYPRGFFVMLEFRTQGFNGYSVKYSPFFDSRIAVATSANFGLVGNGRLYILGLTANGIVAEKWCVGLLAPSYFSNIFRMLTSPTLGSTPKIPSSTAPGPNPTRTSS